MKQVFNKTENDIPSPSVKVGILSFNKYSTLNYGAVLHPYAFQKYLDKNHISNVIIDYMSRHFEYKMPNFPIIAATRNKKGWGYLKGLVGGGLRWPSACIRYRKIFEFCNKYNRNVNKNGRPFRQVDFENNDDIFIFNIIVCESDVIWSPLTNNGFERAFFADFACFKDMRKVAYSPSISNTILTEKQEHEFKLLLNNFDFLSVREHETAEYVQKITGRECAHVLDPTLLLDEHDYDTITAKIKESKKYLLCYNCECNDLLMVDKAKELSRKMGLEFIEVSLNVRNKLSHKVLTSLGIEEFLGYIKNAEFIVTNGFHGMCFSIIFKKNFYVYLRSEFNLKFNLVYKLGLERYFVTSKDRHKYLEDIHIDYSSVYEKLNEFRKVSEEFINKAIVNH